MSRSDIIIDVLMFNNNTNKFKCLTDATEGKYYSLKNYGKSWEKAFEAVILDSIKNTPQVPNYETSSSQETKTSNDFEHLLY